jgi:DHA2 family multidrug resistance protein
MGGSIGISGVEMLLSRRSQYHQSILSAHTASGDHAFQTTVSALVQTFTHAGYDMASATQMAYARVYGLMQAQAAMLAYIDTIWIFGVVCILVVPLAFLMKKNPHGGGGRMAAH